MEKKIKINARIISTSYRNTSYYGNPCYNVGFENTDTGQMFYGRTATDAACAYGINNGNLRAACVLTYHETKAGKIIIDYCRPA